ncbi:MAG TPA: FAD-binding oxidoreductase [Candidatus Binatia bacterium]|nr:FAD-binding oxidoreductase [Candidatus Binatia bacterium]
MKTLNPVGWGYVEDAVSDAERTAVLKLAAQFLGGKGLDRRAPPAPADVVLPASRLRIPGALAACVSDAHGARLLHARGRSFRDLAALRSGRLDEAPDAVATPRSHDELLALLEWARRDRIALIPYGGGSSVVGGVNPEGLADWPGVVTLSLRGMTRVLDVDAVSRTVHAQAGILGPELDAALKPHGLAVRHYPQSYFHSTLGGWVATRGAGHFSTGLAKIEDRVQALGVTLADGRRAETRRLPASSIGPDPNRLWCGSEGALGVITDVHLRCVGLPAQRVSAGVRFRTFEQALTASRALLQAGIQPTQLRVLDPFEHLLSRALSGKAASGALMVLAFESAGAPLGETFAAAQDLCRQHGGEVQAREAEDAVGDWRNTFFRQPYLRDALLDYAIVSDTFETAVPWSAVPSFYAAVREATLQAVQKACGMGAVTCRSTHAYSDGCSLYFAFMAPGRHGAVTQQWWDVKTAASEAVLKHGGTLSHHHAMGRDHRRWAAAEIPEPFRAAVRAARRELDPSGLLNPGLWFDR